MDAVLNLSYNQILELVRQLPLRSRLRLGRALTQEATETELTHFLETFQTNEITEEDILSEVKQVRRKRYAERKEKEGNR